VAAHPNTVGIGRSGEVEGPRQRCAPVEQQGGVVGVVIKDADATDAARLSRPVAVDVESAEVQVVLGRVEFGEIVDVEPLVGFALGLCLRGTAAFGECLPQPTVGGGPDPVDPAVHGFEMVLLVG
jgi:hypothetical protein